MDGAALRGLPRRNVLLAGAGRSGTTWLGKLLDASPEVLYRHEPDNHLAVPWFRNIPSRLDPVPASDVHREAFARAMERSFATHCLHFVRPPIFNKEFLREKPWKLWNLALRGSGRLGLKHAPSLEIPDWMIRGDRRQICFVWKSVMSTLRLAWIYEHFPELRILLILRHPGGYLGSWLRGVSQQGWVGFGSRERLDPTIRPFPRPEHERYADAYEKGSDFERELIYWIVANETPLLELGDATRLKVVVYEDLCNETEKELRAVYEHCELPFSEETQRFVDASTSAHEDGYHSVFKNPAKVAEKWRSELDAEQIDTVERYLQDSGMARYWPGRASPTERSS